MRTSSIILGIAFVICSFTLPQARSNIVLSDFTKELIYLFINEPDEYDYYSKKAKDRKYEIIILTYTDTSNYYLDIYFNDVKSHKCWLDNFVGKTSHLGQRVMVYGDKESFFYIVEKEPKPQKPCRKVKYIRYSPDTWRVALNKDLSFCKDKTYKVAREDDISIIENLAEKYFKIPDDTNENY